MSNKQQAMINTLVKFIRQYFIFEEDPPQQDAVVRLRNSTRCVVQADEEKERAEKNKRRLDDNNRGFLTPNNTVLVPVGGWPVTALEDLVLGALSQKLDEKIWQAVRTHFEKAVIKREQYHSTDISKDQSALHQYPTAGFNAIRALINESETRIHSVRAGCDFQQHFLKTLEERKKKEFEPHEDLVPSGSEDIILSKERVRRNLILFLKTLKEIIEMLLLIRIRHLRSNVPINLDFLGSEKDKETKEKKRRPLYPGGPLAQHNFKEQIRQSATSNTDLSCYQGSLSSRPSTSRSSMNKDRSRGQSVKRSSRSDTHSSANLFDPRLSADYKAIKDVFRKHWPPLWQALAAIEQGHSIAETVATATAKIAEPHLSSRALRHKKSMSSIVKTRNEWAEERKDISKSVEEMLWREDKDKMDTFRIEYATLAHLPVSTFFNTYQYHLEKLLESKRRMRQKRVLYKCELSSWYKQLMDQVHEEVGSKDDEVNALLESIKMYFRLSPTHPKLGRAKMALIVMSMPAYEVCHIHKQKALDFILRHVLLAPRDTLTQWLNTRGLPFVLI